MRNEPCSPRGLGPPEQREQQVLERPRGGDTDGVLRGQQDWSPRCSRYRRRTGQRKWGGHAKLLLDVTGSHWRIFSRGKTCFKSITIVAGWRADCRGWGSRVETGDQLEINIQFLLETVQLRRQQWRC